MNTPPATSSPLYRSPDIFASFPELLAAESTRHGGVSPAPFASLNLGLSTADIPENVAENRSRFWRALGVNPHQVATSHQVHGSEILTVTQPGHYSGYDSLITRHKGILLAVTVADCTPVLIFDLRHEAVAAIHAGWRGTVQGIVTKTLEKMQLEFGTDPADCYAYVGTCIDECSFEVGLEVAEQFSDVHQRFDPATGKHLVDLKIANRDQLLGVGVRKDHIQISAYSTVLHNHTYFSYRHEKGQTGRMLVCIGIV
ncbi:peptidoglycan editing factor PgeF [Salmonirosea aquatica]|uniref:Purine nucleoside phosphorylase n=1 Tax=Salmonirosea aquatica TaxID=2654236 RepID=A0A7C9BIC8_9BACT|nr:peptidoglycan editing factor PgeF [Cytophagaceae bacterium SJW1-29]